MIEGVQVFQLKQFPDERGKVMHMLRSDDKHFTRFGEIYFSVVNPGIIKGWKRHKRMTQNFAVPVGTIKVVIYDNREDSQTLDVIDEITMGEDNYQLLRIPPMLWYGFQGTSSVPALLSNCTDIPHSPDESEILALDNSASPYAW